MTLSSCSCPLMSNSPSASTRTSSRAAMRMMTPFDNGSFAVATSSGSSVGVGAASGAAVVIVVFDPPEQHDRLGAHADAVARLEPLVGLAREAQARIVGDGVEQLDPLVAVVVAGQGVVELTVGRVEDDEERGVLDALAALAEIGDRLAV